MPRIKSLLWELVLFLLASPVMLCLALRRGLRKIRFFAVASQALIFCECGAEVALVGLWKCSCGFTYRGHLVTICPVCRSLPKVVRCYECGVTRRLPDPC
jgi:hypothetical protein